MATFDVKIGNNRDGKDNAEVRQAEAATAFDAIVAAIGYNPREDASCEVWVDEAEGMTHRLCWQRGQTAWAAAAAWAMPMPMPAAPEQPEPVIGKGGVEWVRDDGGRKAANREGRVGDCVTRAFAIASGREYEDVWRMAQDIIDEFVARGPNQSDRRWRRTRWTATPDGGLYDDEVAELGKRLGFKQISVTRLMVDGVVPSNRDRSIGVKAAATLEPDSVIWTASHCAAIVGGRLHDAWDSSRKRVTSIWVANR